jgi:ferredoxin
MASTLGLTGNPSPEARFARTLELGSQPLDLVMPLYAELRRHVLEVAGQGTLLARLLGAGVPVGSSCSGRGACGRCAVRVLEGADALSPPDIRERAVLERSGASTGDRLSCRCKIMDPSARVRLSTGYW